MSWDDNANEDHYFAIPVEIYDEIVEAEDAVARSAPGVRIDIGAAVDAVRITLEIGGGLSTVIVAGQQLKAFSARVARALRSRGAGRVAIESAGMRASLVDLSDEDLYRELARRLAEQPPRE